MVKKRPQQWGVRGHPGKEGAKCLMVFESAASRELERNHEQKDDIEECVGAGL